MTSFLNRLIETAEQKLADLDPDCPEAAGLRARMRHHIDVIADAMNKCGVVERGGWECELAPGHQGMHMRCEDTTEDTP